jgi:multiple sugar transport system permease protein
MENTQNLSGTSWKERYDKLPLEEKEKWLGWALVLPSVLLIGLVILYPLFYNFYLSFNTVPLQPGASLEWVGLDHYHALINSPEFWSSIRTTVVFTLVSSVLATGLGLIVALIMNREFPGRKYARGMILLPYVIPVIAAAFTWRWMLNPVAGVIPYAAQELLGIGTLDVLSYSGSALWTVILFDAWRYYPFAFLMFIARAQSIPDDMYEAAKIDGASRFAMFKDITLPEMWGVITATFLLRWIWNFNKFTDVWLLTRNVDTLPIFTYKTAFANFEMGLGAAVSVLLLFSLMTFVLIYTSLMGDW